MRWALVALIQMISGCSTINNFAVTGAGHNVNVGNEGLAEERAPLSGPNWPAPNSGIGRAVTAGFTQARFNAIKVGMNGPEVVAIAGSPGKKTS